MDSNVALCRRLADIPRSGLQPCVVPYQHKIHSTPSGLYFYFLSVTDILKRYKASGTGRTPADPEHAAPLAHADGTTATGTSLTCIRLQRCNPLGVGHHPIKCSPGGSQYGLGQVRQDSRHLKALRNTSTSIDADTPNKLGYNAFQVPTYLPV